MTSFLVTWFSDLRKLWNLPKAISLESFSAVDCLGQFYRGITKSNDDVIMTLFHDSGTRSFHIL